MAQTQDPVKPAAVVNIHEAKTHLSRLLERVAAGEEIVIAKAGRPVARLVRETQPRPKRKPGGAEGLVKILPGFDDPVPGFEDLY